MCIGYTLQRNASRQVTFADAADGLARAFTKWTGSTCPTNAGGGSRVSIDVRDLGAVDCAEVKYNQNGANQNVIIFRDDVWPHEQSADTLALTTVTYNIDTGEIYDADMEINTHDKHVTLTDPVPSDGYDFASIVTHESGHFLGLAHSGDSHATMFFNYAPGATAMRTLTADDVAGICTVYRPDGTHAAQSGPVTAQACNPTFRHGSIKECTEDEPERPCTVGAPMTTAAPASKERLPKTLAVFLGVSLLGVVRRRQRGAGRKSPTRRRCANR